jgi:hypothetical protein
MTSDKPKKPSKSYLEFEKVILRSLNLISLQETLEKMLPRDKNEGKVDLTDLARAAVVLSVAAMDSYFTDIFAERFIQFLKKNGPTEKIIEVLNKTGFNIRLALELLSTERPYRRIRTLIEENLERHTTQKAETIDALFLAYGLKDFCNHVQNYKRRKRLVRSVEILVERRNQISHDGDTNSYGKLNPITPKDIKKRITDVITFVSGADEILQKQLN